MFVLIYALIGSLVEFTPIAIVALQPKRSAQRLLAWQGWLQKHWQQVLIGLFTFISLYLVGKGAYFLSL